MRTRSPASTSNWSTHAAKGAVIRHRSLFSLAGGDEAQGSPFEVEALDDKSSNFGGSSIDPLGWLWVPE